VEVIMSQQGAQSYGEPGPPLRAAQFRFGLLGILGVLVAVPAHQDAR
jgi:hypothetical protein